MIFNKKIFLIIILLNLFIYPNAYTNSIDETIDKISDIKEKETTILLNENFRKIKSSLDLKIEDLEDLSITATSTEINQALDGISADVTAAHLNTLTTDDFLNITATADEINQALDGISANVTYTNLNTLTDDFINITATSTEINQALDGISANVTYTNLNTLTGGGSANSLHTHPPDYDSDWFTANVATDYTKAHGLTLSIPDDFLDIKVLWRASDAATEVYTITSSYHDAGDSSTETGCYCKYNSTNIIIRGGANGWGYEYIDGSGAALGNGEIRIIVRSID